MGARRKSRCLRSSDTNPHRNLAREEALLLSYQKGSSNIPLLYLWQNANTVVIGRNQNPWQECNIALLESEGGTLARRTTGGGAVYHDLGNLNFSFLMPVDAYDLSRQLSVVRAAVRSFGIDCEFSGRNDLLAQGQKFSGNAFRFTKHGALHHGTLMVDVDREKITRYLTVSKEKLSARGVKSVASRVVNLAALGPVTIEAMASAMFRAFQGEYGEGLLENADALILPDFTALLVRNASWNWNYGAAPTFDVSLSHRFEWGGMELLLTLEEGRVNACRAFTDAMDPELSKRVEAALLGCPFNASEMSLRFPGDENSAEGMLGAWLRTVSL